MFLFVWVICFCFWMHLAGVCIIGLVRGHLFLLGKRRVYFFDPWGRRVCNLFSIVNGFCTKISPRRRRASREGGSENLRACAGGVGSEERAGRKQRGAPATPARDRLRLPRQRAESPGRASRKELPAPTVLPEGLGADQLLRQSGPRQSR